MTTSVFTPAVKSSCFARIAFFGPSGGGKTYSALRMATGMGGKIGVIDTEYGSASKYADRFTFEKCNLTSPNIERMVEAMEIAAKAGINMLIIDSLSHAWQELLAEIDQLAARKFNHNTHAAWSVGTPKQKQLIRAILSYPGHLIATMRSKTDWLEQEIGGRKKFVRVGLNPEQGKGIEYEFDMLMSMTVDHVATVEKDRTGKFQDKVIEKPDEAFGKEIADWLMDGAAPPPPPPPPAPDKVDFARFTKVVLDATSCEAVRKIIEAGIDKKACSIEDKRQMYPEALRRYMALPGPSQGWVQAKIAALATAQQLTKEDIDALSVEAAKLAVAT